MDATLRHVADDEIADGHVVDVLVVRAERGLRVVARRPAGAVQDRAVLADKRIPGLRRDGAGEKCVPALRQNVVLPGLRLTAAWMLAPGEMLMLPAAQVMLGCVPAPGVAGGGATTPSPRILTFEGGRGAWAARSTTSPVTPPKILATSATAS